MKEFLNKLIFSKGLFGGTIWSAIGLLLNSIFYFLFLSFSGKALGADGVGILGVFYSFYMLISFFLGSGFRDYIVRRISELKAKNEYKKVKDLIDETLTYLFFLFVISLLLFLTLKGFLLKRVFNQSFFLFISSFLCLFFFTTTIVGRGFLIGKKIFSVFSFLIFLRGLFFLFFGIFLYVKRLQKIEYFIYPHIFAEFSNFLFFVLYFAYLKRSFIFKINFEFLKHGIFSMSFSNTIFQSFFNYPILLLKFKNVPESLIGNFTAEISLFQALRIFFASYFIPVYPHISSSYYEGKKKKFKRTIYISFILILVLISIFTLFVLLLGKEFLYLFFPKKNFVFYEKEFLLLSFALALHLISRLYSRIFFAIQEEKIVFKTILFWLLIFTIPYVIVRSKDEIFLMLFLLNFSTVIISLIFALFFIKIFNSKGSIPGTKIKEKKNEDIC